MNSHFFVLITILVCCAQTHAQPDSVWSRTFGGSSSDGCYSIQQTADGGFVLGGETLSFGAGSSDFWLVKTDADGDSLWSRTFGGSEWDHCSSVLQTSDGGYVLAGATESFGVAGYDFWLVKTDANGDSLWSRTFGGLLRDYLYSAQQTSDGGYILAGLTQSFSANNFWLVKTDADGNSLWDRSFDRSSNDLCWSVQQTADGGYILGGYTFSDLTNFDCWLVKTDANGDSLWSRTFGGTGGGSVMSFSRHQTAVMCLLDIPIPSAVDRTISGW